MMRRTIAVAAWLGSSGLLPAAAAQEAGPAAVPAFRMPADAAGLDALRARPIPEQLALLEAQRRADPRGLPALFLREEAAQQAIAAWTTVRGTQLYFLEVRVPGDVARQVATVGCDLSGMFWTYGALSQYQHAVDPVHAPVDIASDSANFLADVTDRMQREGHDMLGRAVEEDGAPTRYLTSRLDAAIAHATQAIELGLDGEDLGQTLLLRGCARAFQRDTASAREDFAHAGEVDPRNAAAIATLGYLDSVLGRPADARREFDRAIALTDAVPLLAGPLYVARGDVEKSLGDKAAARVDFARAVEIAPASAPAHLEFAKLLSDLEQHAEAIAHIETAIRLLPEWDEPWLWSGIEHDELKDGTAALGDYSHLIDRFPDSPWLEWAHLRRGGTERALQDTEAANADFAAVDDAKLRTAPELVQRGAAWNSYGQTARAAAAFRRAIDLAPNDPVAHKYLGAMLEKQRDFAGAADEFSRSLALQDDRAVRNVLARMRMLAGQFPAAVAGYRAELAASEPNVYVPLWLYVARMRADVRDEAAARAELRAMRPPPDPVPWVDALRDFMLGGIDQSQLMRAADATPARKPGGHRCEADYYVAEILLAHGDRAGARPLLAEAVDTCPADYIEAESAVAEQAMQAAQGR